MKARLFTVKSLLLVLCVLCALSAVWPAWNAAAEKIEIAMGYIPNVQFAPYYIAREKGFFADEDLQVTFDYGMSTDIMTLVAGGKVDFGISDGDQVILARDKGIPVRVVYTMYVKYPVGIVSFRQKGLSSVSSLRGARVGTPGPYGSNYIGLQVLLHKAGMSLEDIDLEFIEYTQVESLLSGRVDAAVVFINNEPVVLRNLGHEVNLIEAHRVTPMVSAAIIAGENLMKNRPDLVKRFVRAVTRAGEFTLSNRDQVMPLLKKHVPTLTRQNMDINRQVLFASLDLWVDEDIERHGLGYTTREDWRQAIELLHELGMIERKPSAEECFTNGFLPENR
jgi:NitT/TauT family transport system substrate-binding protein